MSTPEPPPDASSNNPRYLPIDRRQHVLRPVDVERLIEAEHSARRIWRLVERLDLSAFEADAKAVEGVAGRPAHSPQVLVSVWIYAYSRGLHSAREIARQMEHEPGLEWLTGLRSINHHTLSDFRVQHGKALRELFEQVLAMLTLKGLITLERVAVDGTKIRADAGKKSFRKRDKIEQHLKAARQHLDALEKAERDEHLSQRREAARRRAAREREQRLEEALEEIERLRAAKKENKKKEPQASSTDPTARFMHTSDGGLAPAYNVQVVADAAQGLIVDIAAVDDPQDASQLAPAMERVKRSQCRYPRQALADSGYTNHPTVVAMASREIDFYGVMTGRSDGPAGAAGGAAAEYRIDAFRYDETANEMICPENKRLGYHGERELAGGRRVHKWTARGSDCGPCPARERCCPKLKIGKRGRSVSVQLAHPAVEAFDRKMATEEAQRIYKQRAPLVEFPNAWIKQKLGLRRFATRGLAKAGCEALWAALTFNVQRMFRLAPDLA